VALAAPDGSGCAVDWQRFEKPWPMENWSFVTSFYFSMVIVSTVGYGANIAPTVRPAPSL
jgi:hypothetical protein